MKTNPFLTIEHDIMHTQSKGCWLCVHVGSTVLYFWRFWNPKCDQQGWRIELNAPLSSQQCRDLGAPYGTLGRWKIFSMMERPRQGLS